MIWATAYKKVEPDSSVKHGGLGPANIWLGRMPRNADQLKAVTHIRISVMTGLTRNSRNAYIFRKNRKNRKKDILQTGMTIETLDEKKENGQAPV